ncbi:MAG: glutamyl-tRNA reductase [Chloroflexi bacterium]|nr:MAG: glutamyl-tRNA reductase [Chloroflexota bacterium]
MLTIPCLCVGLNHQTAPVEVREGVSFTAEEQTAVFVDFPSQLREFGLKELVILSTCNRVELYAAGMELEATDLAGDLTRALLTWLADFHGISVSRLQPYVYQYVGEAAVRHLCRVAAGLDSMVLGEPQILGQVEAAFACAQAGRATGPVLTAVFLAAIRAGKRARTETGISKNAASISSAAVRVARRLLGDLSQRHAVVVGAGEMGQLALKALLHRHIGRVSLVNRTYQRAQELAAHWGGEAFGLEALPDLLATADLVISATGAADYVITPTLVETAVSQRPDRPLVLLDIAVPRNIDPTVKAIAGVELVDMDVLQQQIDHALSDRAQEIPHVERIIEAEITALRGQIRQLAVRPVIAGLRQKAEAIRQQELARMRRYMPEMDEQTWRHIEHLSHSLINKLLHEPTVRLRTEAENGRSEEIASTVRQLFGLEESAS